ncbi:MAG: class I SAM-dependent methyltransferase [Thermoanaerobaculia bacterium]|jgi:SAM-dependent methyltransferase
MAIRCWELDGATRFDGRAALYAKGRPSYPDAVIDFIAEEAGETQGRAADLGAGTGISTRLLARHFPAVVAVEPNIEMALASRVASPRYVLGRTERLPFRDRALDLVTAFNSFHWFVPGEAMPEIDRVLRPGGLLAVVWPDWDFDDPFTKEFVTLMRRAAGDYPVEDRDAEAAPLYSSDRFTRVERRNVPYVHRLDRPGLIARLQSMSFVPTSGAAGDAALAELEELRARFADAAGVVEHHYSISVYIVRR